MWLITLPLNFLLVSWFNRFLDVIGPLRMFLITTAITLFLHALLAFFVNDFPVLCWVHNIWKDLYILLMLQQLWSLIHLQARLKEAKYLYSILFGMGGIGSIFGSLIPSFFATSVGSERLLLVPIVIFTLLSFLYSKVAHYGKVKGAVETKPNKVSKNSLKESFKSPALRYIVTIVILMQVSATILDFSFNTKMAQAFPLQDIRSGQMGKVWSVIGILNLSVQFIGSLFLVHRFGLKKCHLFLPLLLLSSSASIVLLPSVASLIIGFSSIKVIDYSLFNLFKEMLYVPLSDFEKKNAKAVVDVFAYRSSKGIASLLVIGLQSFFASSLLLVCCWSVVGIFALWSILSFSYFRSSSSLSLLYAE